MSSMRFNMLGYSLSWTVTPKDLGIGVDTPAGVHNVQVKCLHVVNRSWIHKGSQVSPQDEIQRIKIR
jgi:hypothetical protein